MSSPSRDHARMARERDSNDAGGCLGLFVVLLLVGGVILAVVWVVSLVGHVLDLTPTYPEIDRHDHAWIDARYENLAWGYVLTVLALVGGVPLSIALSAELTRPRPRVRNTVLMALPLVVLVVAIAVAPIGRR